MNGNRSPLHFALCVAGCCLGNAQLASAQSEITGTGFLITGGTDIQDVWYEAPQLTFTYLPDGETNPANRWQWSGNPGIDPELWWLSMIGAFPDETMAVWDRMRPPLNLERLTLADVTAELTEREMWPHENIQAECPSNGAYTTYRSYLAYWDVQAYDPPNSDDPAVQYRLRMHGQNQWETNPLFLRAAPQCWIHTTYSGVDSNQDFIYSIQHPPGMPPDFAGTCEGPAWNSRYTVFCFEELPDATVQDLVYDNRDDALLFVTHMLGGIDYSQTDPPDWWTGSIPVATFGTTEPVSTGGGETGGGGETTVIDSGPGTATPDEEGGGWTFDLPCIPLWETCEDFANVGEEIENQPLLPEESFDMGGLWPGGDSYIYAADCPAPELIALHHPTLFPNAQNIEVSFEMFCEASDNIRQVILVVAMVASISIFMGGFRKT